VILSTRASACRSSSSQRRFRAGLAAFVDRNRFLKRHLTALEPRDDRFEFLDRALEGELLDVSLRVFGHYLRSRLRPVAQNQLRFCGRIVAGI